MEMVSAGLNKLSAATHPISTHTFDSLGNFVDRIAETASSLES
jgi:hypothetical protein